MLFALTAALAAGVAQGKECKGVAFPDTAQVEGATLTLNGLGLRQATMFKVNVYVAALYVAKTSNDPNVILGAKAPSELILQFVRDVGAADIPRAGKKVSRRTRKQSCLPSRIASRCSKAGWPI